MKECEKSSIMYDEINKLKYLNNKLKSQNVELTDRLNKIENSKIYAFCKRIKTLFFEKWQML